MEKEPPKLQAVPQPPEKPKPYDERTIYAAALICVKQERQHIRSAQSKILDTEARNGHIFVARNCRHMADTILMLIDGNFRMAKARVEMIHRTLDDEEKKLQPKIQVVQNVPGVPEDRLRSDQ